MSVSTTVQTSTRSENATGRAPEECLVQRALLTAGWLVFFLPTVETFAAIDDNQFQEARNATGAPLIDSPGETWGAAWGDLNNDGCPGLWLGMHQYLPTALYRNNCNGRFTNVINSAVTDAAAHYMDDTHGAAWADMDNDGDQDLIEV